MCNFLEEHFAVFTFSWRLLGTLRLSSDRIGDTMLRVQNSVNNQNSFYKWSTHVVDRIMGQAGVSCLDVMAVVFGNIFLTVFCL